MEHLSHTPPPPPPPHSVDNGLHAEQVKKIVQAEVVESMLPLGEMKRVRIWDSLKVIVPEYSCRVTLRTANWEVSFENVARIDFTWFSYCQNTSLIR